MTQQPPVAEWQLALILDYVSLIPISEVDWLLGYYGKESQLHFWTANYSRANELIERLNESVHQ